MSRHIVYVGYDEIEHEIAGEIGIGFFKKLSRSVKSAARSVAKVAKPLAAVGKAIVKSPYVKAAVGGMALVMPVLAPVAAGLVAADKLISMAESADKVRADVAKGMIKATKALAKTGAPDAVRGFKALKAVFKKKRQIKALTPAQRMERARVEALKERENRALLAAARAAKNAPKLTGYLVTADGRIEKGRYIKG